MSDTTHPSEPEALTDRLADALSVLPVPEPLFAELGDELLLLLAGEGVEPMCEVDADTEVPWDWPHLKRRLEHLLDLQAAFNRLDRRLLDSAWSVGLQRGARTRRTAHTQGRWRSRNAHLRDLIRWLRPQLASTIEVTQLRLACARLLAEHDALDLVIDTRHSATAHLRDGTS